MATDTLDAFRRSNYDSRRRSRRRGNAAERTSKTDSKEASNAPVSR
jgi:hypothetical protein